MTPVDPSSGAALTGRAFPLRTGGGGEAARAFALHLAEAHHGLPLHPAAESGIEAPATPGAAARRKLRTISHEFEAAFLRQMFQAMRQSVPHESMSETQAQSQEMFTSMLDDKLASVAAARSHGGLGDALFRQLSTHLPPDTGAATRSDR